jgi:hypothetical protein
VISTPERLERKKERSELPMLLDPSLLKAARQIYRTYFAVRSGTSKRPVGVAINRDTHRGQLIFTDKPVLLPGECFVLLDRLESEVY